jgi:hypothetical protein
VWLVGVIVGKPNVKELWQSLIPTNVTFFEFAPELVKAVLVGNSRIEHRIGGRSIVEQYFGRRRVGGETHPARHVADVITIAGLALPPSAKTNVVSMEVRPKNSPLDIFFGAWHGPAYYKASRHFVIGHEIKFVAIVGRPHRLRQLVGVTALEQMVTVS